MTKILKPTPPPKHQHDYQIDILNKPTLGTMAAVNDAPSDNKEYARKNGSWTEVTGGGGGSAEWGSITGTLSNQTDLQSALNEKQGTLTFDNAPANGSDNPVTSGGIYNALSERDIFHYMNQDVSVGTNAQIMRIPASGTDARITSHTVVLDVYYRSIGTITAPVTWQNHNGYITFTGSCDTASKADITLGYGDGQTTSGTILALQQYLRANDYIPNNTNLNNVKRMGFWWMPTSRTYTNRPNSSADGLLVLKAGSDYYNSGIYQIAFSPTNIYIRTCASGTWSTWKTFTGS